MSPKRKREYPRSCPICGTIRWTTFMDPFLTCGKVECRQEARRRSIPIYKFNPHHNRRQSKPASPYTPDRGR